MDVIDPTPTNMRGMASETLEAFSERRLELFEDEQLLKDLRALKVKEMSYGVKLTSPRDKDGHGDSVTALSLALLAARRRGAVAARLNRPLVCFTLRRITKFPRRRPGCPAGLSSPGRLLKLNAKGIAT